MTPQEIFTTAWVKMTAQGHRSYKIGFGCMYRAPDGSACAVGCMLDDDTARLFDGQPHSGIGSIAQDEAVAVPDWIKANLPLVEAIQIAHDNADRLGFVPMFQARMHSVAVEFGLQVPA